MKKIYLLTTAHLEDGLWFRDEEDFKVAMNYLAIQAACCPEVIVLAFILMSNHVHLVLRGRRKDVVHFVNQFKHRYAIYYRKKYGIAEFLRRNGLDVKLIPDEDEAVERAVAYVQMNCVAANICSHPSQYPWGTGNAFFTSTKPGGTPWEHSPTGPGNGCCIAPAIYFRRHGPCLKTGTSLPDSMWMSGRWSCFSAHPVV